ncbi:Protein NIF3-like protein [Ceratocystis lukuohia]|uniref:Protein NIF3-like protein n=1 Tax=Ceratocystis lukuohia TaxID=2019550 RepID=A0ABR4MRJ2_9PEZI
MSKALQSIFSSTTSILRSHTPIIQAASRTAFRMSSQWAQGPVQVTSPAFTQLVVKGMRDMFPETLADRAWDNVGLLLDNTKLASEAEHSTKPVVMLTNDLTYAAAEEAIKGGASVIISYHPIIFRGLKALTTADPQQATLLLLARHNIAVYSPHTALDAAQKGINTWLVECAVGSLISLSDIQPLKPIASLPAGITYGGYGATVTLPAPSSVASILKSFAAGIGGPSHLNIAVPDGCDLASATVSSIAVCAGSGSDVLRGSKAQLWITGEMSHHDALAAVQKGHIVVTAFHSNTERQFLRQRLQPMLSNWLKTAGATDTNVFVSDADRDPYTVVDLGTL